MQTEKGISLTDIVSSVHELVLRLGLPTESLAYILEKLADIEVNLSIGTSDKLQLGELVGTFSVAKQLTVSMQEG